MTPKPRAPQHASFEIRSCPRYCGMFRCRGSGTTLPQSFGNHIPSVAAKMPIRVAIVATRRTRAIASLVLGRPRLFTRMYSSRMARGRRYWANTRAVRTRSHVVRTRGSPIGSNLVVRSRRRPIFGPALFVRLRDWAPHADRQRNSTSIGPAVKDRYVLVKEQQPVHGRGRSADLRPPGGGSLNTDLPLMMRVADKCPAPLSVHTPRNP